MITGYRAVSVFSPLPLLVILLLGVLVLSGCTGQTGAIPKGWSGGVIADDTLLVGSMEGKLVALNTDNGSRLWAEPLKAAESSGGGLGCAAPAATSVPIYGSPAVAGDLVYVGGYNGKIYAINANTGALRWVYPRDRYLKPIVGGTIVARGKVYFGSSDGKVYALDATTGDEEKGWPFETRDKGDKIWSTPAIDGDTLFIGSFDKKLYALNATNGNKKWEFATEGAIVATPLVDNGTVYIGSFDKYLYAVNATDGRLKWKFMADNWFWAKPVIYDNTIYAANLDGKVYALDTDSGNKLAVFDLGSPLSSSPVLVGNLLIVATEDGVVYALDSANNQPRQLANLEEKIDAPLAASQGIVYIHTVKDALYAVAVPSGAIREFNIK